MNATLARRLWLQIEPIHAAVYFGEHSREPYAAAGLRGGWMGYFASRSAPMGAVSAATVTATFHNFQPAMVARAIPDAWSFSTPERVLAARHSIVDAGLRQWWGEAATAATTAQAADLAMRAALHGDPAGRPLFAAHAALPEPDLPHVRLWHACTLLREHRFDGHVAALTVHGLDGCEVLVAAAAAGHLDVAAWRGLRGWTEEEWSAAEARLRDRGLLTGSGELTDAGRRLRAGAEEVTDALAAPPWTALTAHESARLEALLEPLAEAVRAPRGPVPYPNPVGVPRAL